MLEGLPYALHVGFPQERYLSKNGAGGYFTSQKEKNMLPSCQYLETWMKFCHITTIYNQSTLAWDFSLFKIACDHRNSCQMLPWTPAHFYTLEEDFSGQFKSIPSLQLTIHQKKTNMMHMNKLCHLLSPPMHKHMRYKWWNLFVGSIFIWTLSFHNLSDTR